MGSGRTRRRVTDESTGSFVLSVKGLLGRLPRGAVVGGTVTFRGGRWGELAVEVRGDTTDPAAPYLELTHDTRNGPAQRITYRVRLATTRPRYGGERWWFVCPATGGRAFKLYLPNGGRRFLSRAGYRLGYAVTREDRIARYQRRAGRILAKLGRPDANWMGWASKPKWMRRRTYERLCVELADVQMEGEDVIRAEALRRFGCDI
jgi:hypothetical protein